MNDRQDFAQGLNAFALNLYQILSECQSEGGSKNLVACPFSVAQCLALLWTGASDEKSADELAKVLGFKGRLTKDIVAKLFRDYHEDFLECSTLKMGHKVYVNGAMKLKLKADEDAKKTLENFSIETETAAEKCLNLSYYVETVNKWLAESGKGEELVDDKKKSIIDQLNEPVWPWFLLDLVHFDSPWAIEFPAENTTQQRFWTNESSSVDVQMMHLRETCRYGYMLDLEAAILELDFDFDDISILFLLPDSRTGLPDVLKKLHGTNVMYLAAQLRRQDTLVYMPKFKVDVTFALTQEMLGKFVSEPDATSSPLRQPADRLGGLFTASDGDGGAKKDCVVGDGLLLHRAVIAVGEKGTEKDKQKIDEEKVPEKFMLDRPFVFLLKYKCNIVLIGHVLNPEKP